MNRENDLVLLEIGTRLDKAERLLEEMAMQLKLLIPIVATLQEQTLYRVREMNNKNGKL